MMEIKMKPEVIIVEKKENGLISLTEEQLKKMISDAYDAGVSDGINQNRYYYFTNPTPYKYGYEFTCNGTGTDPRAINTITTSSSNLRPVTAADLGVGVTCTRPHDVTSYTTGKVETD